MKRIVYFLLSVIILTGCSNNSLVGTWQEFSSSTDEKFSISSGYITHFTYEPNGDYHLESEFQIKANDESTVVKSEVKGTWEMIDDTHFRVRNTSFNINDKAINDTTETIFTIITLNKEILETMSNGTKRTFKRIK